MMKYGPTFGTELIAAGCNNGLSWSQDELYGYDALPDEQKLLVDAVIAAHDPTKQDPPPPEQG